ncbi:hypothetical protein Sru01_20380 [Sphaerisporangium rufum]|uniref:Histidine kinase/HSP90-like ATPase domain-containing protein n=1 Tax=Sphaerisporangium rufum TaxID=1381558 RepID=A0A919R281_9ACTN|nr:ATP-binding protein [Sphaerisporangium rufum]GII77056.1 hypothetical protein Sru01_20380 [Sphaerisporangium rufum]
MHTGDQGQRAEAPAAFLPPPGGWLTPELRIDAGRTGPAGRPPQDIRLLGQIDLPGEPASAAKARGYLRVVLAGLGHPRADDAVLLVSELVANSARHSDSRLPGGKVTVAVAQHGGTLHIDVIDAGSATSVPWVRTDTDAESCTGRGLWLVQALASAWGWVECDAGRVVWFQCAGG